MKAFRIAICLLVSIIFFITTHAVIMFNLADKINKNCHVVTKLVDSEKWDAAISEIDKLHQTWNNRRIWAALTMPTNEIEQIEISLNQSRKYAELHQKPDFYGEFTMFSMLVEHIPHQEGFHIAEIL